MKCCRSGTAAYSLRIYEFKLIHRQRHAAIGIIICRRFSLSMYKNTFSILYVRYFSDITHTVATAWVNWTSHLAHWNLSKYFQISSLQYFYFTCAHIRCKLHTQRIFVLRLYCFETNLRTYILALTRSNVVVWGSNKMYGKRTRMFGGNENGFRV